uniref:Lipid membrane protein n=1 Tax=Pithovirus LCPAC304 TaxID=2506594 RepID=A0A481Z8P4_9VIRU|nr:MAG: lipid membrane protein [Pithovirus LCPAC304]
MGNKPVAKNIVDENLSAIASVINEAVQNCSQTVTQDIFQQILIQNTDIAGNLEIGAEQTLILKQDCLQSEKAETKLDSSLQAVASQTAQAIAQQLELSGAKAKNVIKINAEIASSIKNWFVQNCSQESSQLIAQNVTLTGDTIGGSVILQADNYTNNLIKCSTQGSATLSLKSSLETEISQSATAKVESFFGPFFMAILIIIGVIALFLFLPALFRGRTTVKQAPAAKQDDGALSLLAALGSESPSAGGVAAQALSSRATPTPSARATPSSAPRRAMPPRSTSASRIRGGAAPSGMGSLRRRAMVQRPT